MSPMQQGKVKTALAKSGNYSGYGVLTRAEFIEKSVAEGKEIAAKNTYVEKYRAMALPAEEQRKGRAYLLKTLNDWNYNDTTSQKNMLNRLDGVKVTKDSIFIEMPSSTLEWTVDKQKYVYQMTPYEYYDYISKYLVAIENARKKYGGNTIESYEQAKDAAKKVMSEYKKKTLKNKYFDKAVKNN